MRIYIIGLGKMGSAIAKSLANDGHKLCVVDHNVSKTKKINNTTTDLNLSRISSSQVVLLAVKPQDMALLAREIKHKLNPDVILISIAAGVVVQKLKNLFGVEKVVRIMPNLGVTVGQGVGVWKMSGLLTAEKKQIEKLIKSFMVGFEVADESKIHAATAVSASGIGYFFYLAEALQKAAMDLGFSEKQSRLLVEKTFLGAASLQNATTYSELIAKVRTKKGTTDAALNFFAKKNADKIIIQAVEAAYKRAKELSNG